MIQTNVITYGNLKKEMTIPLTVGKPWSVLRPFLTLIRNKTKGKTMTQKDVTNPYKKFSTVK